MNKSESKDRRKEFFAQRYETELRQYIDQRSRAKSLTASELGREALALGLEVLDLATIHQKVVIVWASSTGAARVRDRIIRRAGKFFAEAIIPMEETHRTALEANARLSLLNQTLGQRTADLSAANRELKREIEKRKLVEQALRKSEQHSGLLLAQSRRLQAELRRLSRRILSTQEEERKRISRELHDLVAQTLTAINVHLATLKTESVRNAAGLAEEITRTQKLVEESVDKVHRFARELRPAVLDDLGLTPALRSFMEMFMEETGVRVSLTVFAGVEALSNAKRTALYRVAQEALTNVARHASAGRVEVRIERLRNAVRMQIHDDGCSFDVERVQYSGKKTCMGLIGMRERVEMVGGKFIVESEPGRGTIIGARIPFRNITGEQA